MGTNTKYIKSELVKMRRAISELNYTMDNLERHLEYLEDPGKAMDRGFDLLEDFVISVENETLDEPVNVCGDNPMEHLNGFNFSVWDTEHCEENPEDASYPSTAGQTYPIRPNEPLSAEEMKEMKEKNNLMRQLVADQRKPITEEYLQSLVDFAKQEGMIGSAEAAERMKRMGFGNR